MRNESQPRTTQTEMPLLGPVRSVGFAPWALIERCRDPLDAVRLCVQLSGQSNESIAAALGIDKGHFTRMMQGRAHFPTRKLGALMRTCGNLAVVQCLAADFGLRLIEQPAERIAALEAELSDLRARAA